VIDVDLGHEVSARAGEFAGEIVFARFFCGEQASIVNEAESFALGVGGESAEASVGEFEGTEIEGISGSCVRHDGESIAKKY
jgi:hypothetical protein